MNAPRSPVILVVHEDPEVRESLARWFTKTGWSARAVERLPATDDDVSGFDYVVMAPPQRLQATPPANDADALRPLEAVEWEHIQSVLCACRGNVTEAARLLGVHRRTLQRKLRTAAS